MRALAVDPGITTGIAVVDIQNFVLHTESLQDMRFAALSSMLRFLHGKWEVDTVVIEEGPVIERQSSRFLMHLDGTLRDTFPDAVWMRPAEWKPTPRAKLPVPGVRSKHERDAARMGFEHLHRLRRNHA